MSRSPDQGEQEYSLSFFFSYPSCFTTSCIEVIPPLEAVSSLSPSSSPNDSRAKSLVAFRFRFLRFASDSACPFIRYDQPQGYICVRAPTRARERACDQDPEARILHYYLTALFSYRRASHHIFEGVVQHLDSLQDGSIKWTIIFSNLHIAHTKQVEHCLAGDFRKYCVLLIQPLAGIECDKKLTPV